VGAEKEICTSRSSVIGAALRPAKERKLQVRRGFLLTFLHQILIDLFGLKNYQLAYAGQMNSFTLLRALLV
jgi:hypothetical protein